MNEENTLKWRIQDIPKLKCTFVFGSITPQLTMMNHTRARTPGFSLLVQTIDGRLVWSVDYHY